MALNKIYFNQNISQDTLVLLLAHCSWPRHNSNTYQTFLYEYRHVPQNASTAYRKTVSICLGRAHIAKTFSDSSPTESRL